jgi:NAD-dependent SIR2 family protein deacetylase
MPVPWNGTVYILGAGCSADDGGPLIDSFWTAAQRTLQEAEFLDSTMKDFFRGELDWRGQHHPDLNVERLFSYYDLQALMEEDPEHFSPHLPTWSGDLAALHTLQNGGVHRAHLEYVIAKTLHHCVRRTPSPNYTRFVDAFLQPEQALALNLNWDTLLANAAQARGLTVADASDTYPRRELLPANQALILPMHGAADLWICRACRQTTHIAEATGIAIREQTSPQPACAVCAGFLDPSVVPPTLTKFGPGSPHTVPVARTWNSAANLALGARRLVLIGYSLPESDQQFHSFLRYLCTFTRLETVEVVNPHPHDVAQRVRNALGPHAPEPVPVAKTFAQWLAVA